MGLERKYGPRDRFEGYVDIRGRRSWSRPAHGPQSGDSGTHAATDPRQGTPPDRRDLGGARPGDGPEVANRKLHADTPDPVAQAAPRTVARGAAYCSAPGTCRGVAQSPDLVFRRAYQTMPAAAAVPTPTAVAASMGLVGSWMLAILARSETGFVNTSTGQSREPASLRSARSGLTAEGCPTASSIGRS